MRLIAWFPVMALYVRYSTGKMYDVSVERTELVEANPKYVRDWSAYTHRLNRTSPYTFVANFTLLQPLYNNASINIIIYELRSNEYREGAVTIKNKLCDWMRTDTWIFPLFRKYGNLPERCPIYGNVLINDLWVPSEMMPSFTPFEGARLDFYAFTTHPREVIFTASIYVKVVQRARRITLKKKKGDKSTKQ